MSSSDAGPQEVTGPPSPPSGPRLGRVVAVMLVAVLLYGVYAVYSGLGRLGASLARFSWLAFGAACALAFGNYVLRYLKWEFYLARLEVRASRGPRAGRSIPKLDSFLTFLSGFVLTITPGKVGEVFKSWVLFETYGVPIARTAPIVIAERVTDMLGIVTLIVLGSLGFRGGLVWAGAGAAVVSLVLVVVASPRLSLGILALVERLPGRLGRLGPKLHEAYDSLATLLKLKNLALPTVLSIVAWSLECLALWVILGGFGETTPVPLCLFFYATSTLAGALVPVPGGLGVTEGALEEQMRELGHVAPAVSTASMMLVRFATLWFAVLVGFIALSFLRQRHRELGEARPAPRGTPPEAPPRTASSSP